MAMGLREDEKRWKLIQDMLSAEASGNPLRPATSQRTLFGIPSEMEKRIERIVAEDEASRRSRRNGQDPENQGGEEDAPCGLP